MNFGIMPLTQGLSCWYPVRPQVWYCFYTPVLQMTFRSLLRAFCNLQVPPLDWVFKTESKSICMDEVHLNLFWSKLFKIIKRDFRKRGIGVTFHFPRAGFCSRRSDCQGSHLRPPRCLFELCLAGPHGCRPGHRAIELHSQARGPD